MNKHITGIILSSSLLLLSWRAPAQPGTPGSGSPEARVKNWQVTLPGSPLGIAWGFLYGYQSIKAEQFMPQLRELGARFTKIYLLWNQVEPEKGQYDWTAVDSFVKQLKSPEEGLIALFSSSQWAAKHPAAMLPPSPAKNLDDYYRFVNELVKHCQGRVRYWQNDSEPNNPVFWSGTKEEFVAQLKIFRKAVKDADPAAVVVVGGYDGLFGPPGTFQFPNQQAGLDFFDFVLKEGHEAFDVFDLRLYGDPYTIVGRVDFMRQKMIALGFEKPIICTEYGGPAFYQYAENRKYLSLVSSWTKAGMTTDANGLPLADAAGNSQIADLYKNMGSLAPETQMFMLGCTPELEAKYNRIQARGLVMRNLFAFSAGVQKTLYWQLLADHGPRDDLMTLMYGKIGMIGHGNGAFTKRTLTADAFQRMARALEGLRAVKRIDVPAGRSIVLFEVDRGARGAGYVVWEQRNDFTGEDSPAVPFDWAWRAEQATAVDVLGQPVSTQVANGRVHLSVSLTPIFVEPGR